MQVTIHKFKSHLSDYTSKVQTGELIELTLHRKVVARVIGVPNSEVKGPQWFVSTGLATWQGGKPLGSWIKLAPAGKSIAAMVMEDRG